MAPDPPASSAKEAVVEDSSEDEDGNESSEAEPKPRMNRRVSQIIATDTLNSVADQELRDVQRAQLQHVQSISSSFRGFDQDDLDAL